MPSTTTDRLNGLTTSLAIKPPCKTVTTTSVTLSGEQTVGGIACVTGDRVLVAITGGSVNNGIWVVDTGAWSRATDFNGARDAVCGTIILVKPGSGQAQWWEVTNSSSFTIGTTVLTIEQHTPEQLDLRADLAASSGASLIGVINSGTGATADTVQAWYRRIGVMPEGFGADNTAAGDSAAVQLAINEAQTSNRPLLLSRMYKINQQLEVTSTIAIIGCGYDSGLVGQGGAHIILLVQEPTFAEITGIHLANFRIDGGAGGQPDAGLLACNNARGTIEGLWVHNGGVANGTDNVNGISMSAGSPGGFGNRLTVMNCNVWDTTKAGYNWTSESVDLAMIGCKAWDIAGVGTAPGFQFNGGFNGKVVACDAYNTEGPGFYVQVDSLGNPSRNTIFTGCIARECGATSASQADGWLITAGSTGAIGRITLDACHAYDCGNVSIGGSGFSVINTDGVTLDGCFARGNRFDGVRLQDVSHISITGGLMLSNNQAAATYAGGIQIRGTCSHINLGGGLHCSDDQGSPTQSYGVIIDSGAAVSSLRIDDTHLAGNVLGPFLASGPISSGYISMRTEKQTTDGSASTMQAITLADNTAAELRAFVVGKKSDASDRAIYSRQGAFYRDGAGAAQQGATTTIGTDLESDATWGGASLGVTGNQIVASVQGLGATTINWRADLAVQII